MESQFAFLCAAVTPESEATGGRLTIEGFPIRTIPVTRLNPVIPKMTLVVGVTYSVDEAGRKDVEFRLLGPDGTFAAKRTWSQFPQPSPGDRGTAGFICRIPDLPIHELGEYEFGLHVGDELVATVPFRVVAES